MAGRKKLKVFYNDLDNHVTISEGFLVEQNSITIIIETPEKIISIPMNKVVRIEEEK
jgi:hypothetical protein